MDYRNFAKCFTIYTIFVTYIVKFYYNPPVMPKIISLIKSPKDIRQTETGDLFFRILGVMKRGENMKVVVHRMDPITILP